MKAAGQKAMSTEEVFPYILLFLEAMFSILCCWHCFLPFDPGSPPREPTKSFFIDPDDSTQKVLFGAADSRGELTRR